MIERHELSALAKSLGRSVKEYVAATLVAVSGRIDSIEERVKSIPQGEKGDRGDAGENGEKGDRGSAGEKGDKGDTGIQGEAGPRGEKGNPGEKGQPAEKGEVGERGPKGDKGDPGERGEKGELGLSIKGDFGERGPNGEKGDPGDRGEKGETGTPGQSIKGDSGEHGEKGIDGKDGRDGRDGIAGKDGRDGEPGRDALQLDPLPGIDPQKSYLRGTWAYHKGGLCRFDGQQWHCMVRGIDHETDELSEDHRIRTRKTFYTDGTFIESISRSPVMLMRDIFKASAEYCKGDVVVWDNSSWCCVVESTKSVPGTSPDWRLMSRKGSPGKEGKQGPEGKPGKDGRDGRDLTYMGPDGRKY